MDAEPVTPDAFSILRSRSSPRTSDLADPRRCGLRHLDGNPSPAPASTSIRFARATHPWPIRQSRASRPRRGPWWHGRCPPLAGPKPAVGHCRGARPFGPRGSEEPRIPPGTVPNSWPASAWKETLRSLPNRPRPKPVSAGPRTKRNPRKRDRGAPRRYPPHRSVRPLRDLPRSIAPSRTARLSGPGPVSRSDPEP
jgi:hypothetical protein